MSTHLRNRSQLAKNLRRKAYRDAFVNTHISNGIAFQIRAMRDSRKWKQKDLAEMIETKQEAVSRLENPDYGRFTLETLKKLASVFDVALIVRFAPFSELADKISSLTPDDIQVPQFSDDAGFSNYRDSANVQSIFGAGELEEDFRVVTSASTRGDELRHG